MIDETYLRKLIRDASRHKSTLIISHLSFGEAYYTTLSKHGREQADTLIETVSGFLETGVIGMIDHDEANTMILRVHEHTIELAFADTVHLGTALSMRCEYLITTDPDLLEQKSAVRTISGPVETIIRTP